jgi:hypothetical protein
LTSSAGGVSPLPVRNRASRDTRGCSP